jgi:hypothetical protein
MKVLRNIVLFVVALAVLLGVVSLFMPSTFSVQRSAVIPMEAGAVYAKFATPRTWAQWSAWSTQADPTLAYTYEGPDSGVGAIMKWTAKKMGNGQLEIVQAVPGQEVRYELRMQGGDMAVHGHVGFEAQGGSTNVTWHDRGDFGRNPLYRLFGPMMDGMLGGSFEKSLGNLKREAGGR